MSRLEIKSLQTQLHKVEVELKQLANEQQDLKNKTNKLEKSRRNIQQRMRDIQNASLKVTEHALLRLCERKFELPIDKMESELKRILGNVKMDGRYPLGDGLFAVVKHNTIITIEK